MILNRVRLLSDLEHDTERLSCCRNSFRWVSMRETTYVVPTFLALQLCDISCEEPGFR